MTYTFPENLFLFHFLLNNFSFCIFLQANFESECFSVVIDRGGLDMVYKDVSSGQRTESNVTEYFKEIQRLLKVGGRYLCFSVAALDILDKLMDYFSPGWFFRVHLLGTQTSDGKPGHLPVFCFVLTKTKFTGQYKFCFIVLLILIIVDLL